MKRFVIIVNGWKPLTIITKRSILDVTAVLDLPVSVPAEIRGDFLKAVIKKTKQKRKVTLSQLSKNTPL